MKVNEKKGGVALEASIVTPIFLLSIVFLLQLMICIRSETYLMQAVDQVSAEMAVAAPAAGAGLQAVTELSGHFLAGFQEGNESGVLENVGQVIGGIGAVFEGIGIEGEDILGTILLGEVVRDRILSYYQSYDNKSIPMNSISDVSVYLDFNNEEKWIRLEVYYVRNTLFGKEKRELYSLVPLYERISFAFSNTEDSSADAVWELGNFQRGTILNEKFGGNLPFTYPVISKWENGTATSIKSIDMTAPSYQSGMTLEQKILGHLFDLSHYFGTNTPWGSQEIFIQAEDIKRKSLFLVIPKNAPMETLSVLNRMKDTAAEMDLELHWEYYGNSYRYEEKDLDKEEP